jgi:hypothetical protein
MKSVRNEFVLKLMYRMDKTSDAGIGVILPRGLSVSEVQFARLRLKDWDQAAALGVLVGLKCAPALQ